MLITNTKSLNRLVASVLTIVVLIPLSVSAQTARTPVAPRRELVEQVAREAYEKVQNRYQRKECGLHTLSRAGRFHLHL